LPNNKGAWVAGNARIAGSFSAKVKLYYDSQTAVAGACAYASNYPPVAEYATASSITFTGTPGYKIVFKDTGGSPFDGTSDGTYTILAGETIDTFTDKTGAPGIIKCIPPATHTLTASPTAFCEGDAGATFSLDGTQSDVKYQLYRDGTMTVGDVLAGTGSAKTFSGGPFKDAGTYTAKSVAELGYCAVLMTGSPEITVNPLPASLSLMASPAAICKGASSTLTASASSGTSYSLDNSDWQTTTTFNVTPTSDTSYTLYVSTSAGCSATKANAAMVAVNALPDNPSVVAGKRCGAGTVTLSASSSGAVIDWYDVASGGTSLTTGTGLTPEITASTTYYVEARFEATGCVSARVPVLASANACCDAPGDTVNFTAFNPCANAATYSVWYLADTREEADNSQTYTVKLMEDNHYWMVQDMKFGNKCGTAFDGSYGHDQTNNVSDIGSYYGDCRSNTVSGAGYFYDWAAAINSHSAFYGGSHPGCSGTGGGTTDNNPGACMGICPTGWHVPTGASDGEFINLHNKRRNCSNSNSSCWDGQSEWSSSAGGVCYGDDNVSKSPILSGYWSSTRQSAVNVYALTMETSTANPSNGIITPFYGATVRCVKNY
jgi:uncharacterized protein (TIGR02145 family)